MPPVQREVEYHTFLGISYTLLFPMKFEVMLEISKICQSLIITSCSCRSRLSRSYKSLQPIEQQFKQLGTKIVPSKKSVTLGVTFVTSIIIDNLEIVTFGDERWHPVWKSVTFQNNSIIGVFWFFLRKVTLFEEFRTHFGSLWDFKLRSNFLKFVKA